MFEYRAEEEIFDVFTLISFLDAGIFHLGGPGWEETVQGLCEQEIEPLCQIATESGSSQARSIIMLIHFAQNSDPEVGRFQELVDLQDWIDGEKFSEEVDLTLIDQVPISYFSHKGDASCLWGDMREMTK